MATILVILSAHAEWQAAKAFYPQFNPQTSLYGETIEFELQGNHIVLLEGGWGKISAAASCQYGVQHWRPALVINFGTCGGFEGLLMRGSTILVEKTIVYDIYEQMGDPQQALDLYSTTLDLSWLKEPFPQPVQRGLMLSADRDIIATDIKTLQQKYAAIAPVLAADWESGAVAWVAAKNRTHCLILRTVSDLVNANGGEAYGNFEFFQKSSLRIIHQLLENLAGWITCSWL